MVQLRVGRDRLQTLPQAVVRRHDGRPLRRQPHALAHRRRLRIIRHLGHIVPRQRRDPRPQRIHRMRVFHHLQHGHHPVRDPAAGP